MKTLKEKTSYLFVLALTFTQCDGPPAIKTIAEIKAEMVPINLEENGKRLFESILIGLEQGSKGSEIAYKTFFGNDKISIPEYRKINESEKNKVSNALSNNGKLYLSRSLAVFSNLSVYKAETSFDFKGFSQWAGSVLSNLESEVIFDSQIRYHEKQIILVSTTLLSIAINKLDELVNAYPQNQHSARIEGWLSSIWDAIVKITSVIVSTVVNAVLYTIFSFTDGSSDGIISAFGCGIAGSIVGGFEGLISGITCDSYDFDCLLDGSYPSPTSNYVGDYPCANAI